MSLEEKNILAVYMTNLLRRVPRGLERANNIFPKVTENVEKKMINEIDKIAFRNCIKATHTKEKIKQAVTKIRKQGVRDIWLNNLKKHDSSKVVEIINKMTWVFLYSKSDLFFLTSDNPVFYFEWLGLNNKKSEISFPISSRISLWVTWGDYYEFSYCEVPDRIVKEFNRRTVRSSMRYIYHCKEERWIKPFIMKGVWDLNHLQ